LPLMCFTERGDPVCSCAVPELCAARVLM
jgi:hypothetical protein